MKALQRIPTTQYGFIELEMEYDSPQEAIIDHTALVKMYEEGVGLSKNEWAKVRNKMLETCECDPNLFEQMNKAQRWWINETKNALRAAKDVEINERHHSLQTDN